VQALIEERRGALANDPVMSSAAALLPPLVSGHAPTRDVARRSATLSEPSRPGRAMRFFPLGFSPGGAHGIL